LDSEKKIWPTVVLLTAVVVGGSILYMHFNSKDDNDSVSTKLRNAEEIIDQCHKQLKEIEVNALNRLDSIKEA
jgi:hypothetical protein